MRNQAHSLMSLVMVAGVAAAGFIGACGGKVVVDASNPSGGGGAGGAGGGISVVNSQAATGQPTGPIMTSGLLRRRSGSRSPRAFGADDRRLARRE